MAPIIANRALVADGACDTSSVRLTDVSGLAERLDGVAETTRGGMLNVRYRGRLVARQLDDRHIVIGAWELQSGHR
jgi:hypothetical protein